LRKSSLSPRLTRGAGKRFPIYDTEGVCTGIGAFVTDITERERLDAERLALKEQVIMSPW
jgi:hypothetical protein